MSFPQYEKYNDSGVEWLGKIPQHWSVKAIKHIVSIPITDGPHETPDFYDEGIPFVSAEAVSSGEIDFTKIRGFISRESHEKYSLKYLPKKGDIYMVKSGATTGVSAIVETHQEFNIWSPLAVIRCKDEFNPYFILNYIRSLNFQEGIAINWSFGTQQNIGMGVIENLMCPAPSLDEQTLIVNFLKKEITKINALVNEQENLILLLKEKRRAVISHTVTKGLNPEFKLKDSGVDWLGKVPEHWNVKKIRYLLERNNGLVRGPFGGDLKKEIFVKEGVKVLEQKNAIYRDLMLGDSYITPEKFNTMKRFEVRPGDFIMSCSGTIGKIFKIPEGSPVAIINQALMIMRFTKEISSEFLDWIFQADFFVNQILDNSQGGAMKNLVGMDIFTAISFPCPPLDEQLAISKMLLKKMDEFDRLIEESLNVVNLLKERRTALISSAVTGQIDVRNYQLKEAA